MEIIETPRAGSGMLYSMGNGQRGRSRRWPAEADMRQLVLAAALLGFLLVPGPVSGQQVHPYDVVFSKHYFQFGGWTSTDATAAAPYDDGRFRGSVGLEMLPSTKATRTGSGPIQMNPPITATVRVRYTVTLPAETPEKEHTATVVVTIADEMAGSGQAPACRKPVSVTARSGQSTALAVDLVCQVTSLGSWSYQPAGDRVHTASEVATDVYVSLDTEMPSVKSIGSQFEDVLTLDTADMLERDVTPGGGSKLVPGGKQGFTANVNCALRSRTAAELDLQARDEKGRQVAGLTRGAPVSYSFDSRQVPVTLPPFEVPVNAGRLDVVAVLRDPSTRRELARSRVVSYPVGDCALRGEVKAVQGRRVSWLPGVPVELWDVTGEPVRVARTLAVAEGTSEEPRAEYCLKLTTPLDPKKRYQLRSALQYGQEEATSKFFLADFNEGAFPVELAWRSFVPDGSAVRDLVVGGTDMLPPVDHNKNPRGPGVAEGAAEIYWHVWRQLEYLVPSMSRVRIQRDLPMRVYVNMTGDRSYFCSREGGTNCPNVGAIVLEDIDSRPGANPDVVWHEFGHKLLRELYGGEIPRRVASADPAYDRNHNGYGNTTTAPSMDEGFATFWAVVSRRALLREDVTAMRLNTPAGTPVVLDIEQNHHAWDTRRAAGASGVPPLGEELAFAGVLFDLIDGNGDGEPSRAFFSDTVRVDLPEVMTVFEVWDKKEAEKPGSILEVHRALEAKFPSLAGVPPDHFLSRLDQIFVLHGLFADNVVADWLWDPGEEIGRVTNGATWDAWMKLTETWEAVSVGPRPARQVPPLPFGAAIEAALVDEKGQPASVADLDVTLTFGGGVTGLDATTRSETPGGSAGLLMPPPHYDVKATINVPGSLGPPLVVDNRDYWSRLGTGATVAAHTFVVPLTPRINALTAASGPAGAHVLVTGRGFGETPLENAVLFGIVPATVTAASASELTVLVPEGLAAGPAAVTVTVDGRTSEPASFRVTAGVLDVQPAVLDFGGVAPGQAAERTVTVRNLGDADLDVLAVAADLATVRPTAPATPFRLAPSASQVLTVRFAPLAPGPASGRLLVTSSDRVRRTAAVAVSGTGSAAPDLEVAPGGLGFGTVASGQKRTLSLTLKSTGTVPLTVRSATASQATFKVTGASFPVTLAAGGQLPLAVEFAPPTPGSWSGTLTLATDAPGHASAVVPLRGEGVPSSASSCTFAVSPGEAELSSAEAALAVTVASASGCGWSATSTAPWVTVRSGATGSGNGTVSLSIATNATSSARSATVTVAGVAVSLGQAAAGAVSTTFVPIVVSTTGVGASFFSSELTLTNRSGADAIAEVAYASAFGGGGGTSWDVVPAGGQVAFPDALSYLRSIGVPVSAEGNRGGTLQVSFHGVADDAASATVRTSSLVPEGRAGLAYGGVPPGAALGEAAWICGLRQNGADRSNLALQNAGREADGPVTLRPTVVSGDPGKPVVQALPDVTLSPGGFAQTSGVLGSNGLSLTNGYVLVERVSGSAPFWAYGVINDQANGDGSYVAPVVESALAGKAGLVLPVVVETTAFSTELVVTNGAAAARTLRLEYVADAVSTPDRTARFSLALAPREQAVIPDLVEELRRRGVAGVGPKGPSFVGALFASVDGGDVSRLLVGARTSTPGGGGRYGLFYQAVPNGSGATSSAWLYGLRQDDENRTNLAFVNTGEVDAGDDVFRVDVYDGTTGRLATSVPEITVGARRFAQLSSFLADRAPGVTSAYVKVTKTAGQNPFVVYAVVNDGAAPGQRSGDGAFVAMSDVDRPIP